MECSWDHNYNNLQEMIVKITGNLCRLAGSGRYGFGMLNDYLTKKNVKKQEAEFKKEMEYLANKPSFTLMDYKQRIEDELDKLKKRSLGVMQNSEPR